MYPMWFEKTQTILMSLYAIWVVYEMWWWWGGKRTGDTKGIKHFPFFFFF